MATRFLRRTEVQLRTGLGKTTIYDLMKSDGSDRFPQTVKLGGRIVTWVENEVDDWMARQIAARSKAA